jgi:hypothetical protein
VRVERASAHESLLAAMRTDSDKIRNNNLESALIDAGYTRFWHKKGGGDWICWAPPGFRRHGFVVDRDGNPL